MSNPTSSHSAGDRGLSGWRRTLLWLVSFTLLAPASSGAVDVTRSVHPATPSGGLEHPAETARVPQKSVTITVTWYLTAARRAR